MIQLLKISQIEVHENPRKDFSGVDELAKSIEQFGLLQPIAVRPVDGLRPSGSEKYVLVDGEQRLRAFKQLKREEIPAYSLKELNAHEAKEAQMVANLTRSDLSMIERMRGFSALLETAPAKYNEKVIANKFGLKEKEVKKMVGLAKKLDPAIDSHLASGHFDSEDFEELAKIPKEYQVKVVKAKGAYQLNWAIRSLASELYFDDVFKKEQARSEGKLHYDSGYSCYTFDKEYAEKVKAEYEARTKKSYTAEKEKAKNLSKEQIEKQKKETRAKQQAKLAGLLAEMKELLPKFLQKAANFETMMEMRDRFISGSGNYGLMAEDAKLLLKAWGVEFKASELSTSDLRKMVDTQIFNDYLKNETHLVNLYEFLTIEHGFTTLEDQHGFRSWINQMRKALK